MVLWCGAARLLGFGWDTSSMITFIMDFIGIGFWISSLQYFL